MPSSAWSMGQPPAADGADGGRPWRGPAGAGGSTPKVHRPFSRHLLFFLGIRPDAQDEIAAIKTASLRHYYRMAGHHNYLYSGVASLLHILKGRGVCIGILIHQNPYAIGP